MFNVSIVMSMETVCTPESCSKPQLVFLSCTYFSFFLVFLELIIILFTHTCFSVSFFPVQSQTLLWLSWFPFNMFKCISHTGFFLKMFLPESSNLDCLSFLLHSHHPGAHCYHCPGNFFHSSFMVGSLLGA